MKPEDRCCECKPDAGRLRSFLHRHFGLHRYLLFARRYAQERIEQELERRVRFRNCTFSSGPNDLQGLFVAGPEKTECTGNQILPPEPP